MADPSFLYKSWLALIFLDRFGKQTVMTCIDSNYLQINFISTYHIAEDIQYFDIKMKLLSMW